MGHKGRGLSPCLAYLVRCWPVETEDGFVWRATIEGAHDAERRSFADLDALFVLMTEKTEACLRDVEKKRD